MPENISLTCTYNIGHSSEEKEREVIWKLDKGRSPTVFYYTGIATQESFYI